MPTKSMRVSLNFFLFSRNMENLNYRSDFKMDQIFEILSEFAHSGIWWSWKWKLSKNCEKSRFSTFWTSYMLQKPLSPIRICAPFSRSRAYSASILPNIDFFSLRSKKQMFSSIILRFEQNPTETRWSGLKWNLSVPSKNSTFSHISSNFS